MPILMMMGFAVGFLIALKLSFAVALALLVIASFAISQIEWDLETVMFLGGTTVQAWLGAIVAWIYYYINYHPSTGFTIGKFFSWFFTP